MARRAAAADQRRQQRGRQRAVCRLPPSQAGRRQYRLRRRRFDPRYWLPSPFRTALRVVRQRQGEWEFQLLLGRHGAKRADSGEQLIKRGAELSEAARLRVIVEAAAAALVVLP